MESKIALIKFNDDKNYITLFEDKRNIENSLFLRTVIETKCLSYKNGFAIAFIEDDELFFYIAPEEFINSEYYKD